MTDQGAPIEILYVELAAKTESLQKDIAQTLAAVKRQIENDLDKPIKNSEKNMIGLGQVMNASMTNFVSTLVGTRNPLAAINAGLQTVNGGVQAMAAQGSAVGASLAAWVAPVAAVSAGLITILGTLRPIAQFLESTGERGKQLAARVETLQEGLGVIAKNAGQDVDYVRKKVQDLERTGITTQESIESIMQFLSNKLPVDNIEKLARVGQDMAVAYGQNSTQTFNRFVHAILTGNNEVLRMVGIQKTASQMQEEYAASIGKTANQLSDLERRQAVINGIMKAGEQFTGLYEKSMESLGKRIGSLPRYIEQGTLAFGQTLIPTLNLTVTATEKFWKGFRQMFVEVQNGSTVLDNEGNPKLTKFGQIIFDIADGIVKTLLPAVDKMSYILPDVADQFARILDALQPVIRLFQNLWDVTVDAGNSLNMLFAIQIDDRLLTFTEAVGEGLKVMGQVAIIAAAGVADVISIVADLLEMVDRINKGEKLRSVQEILNRGKAAGDEMFWSLLPGKETIAARDPQAAFKAYTRMNNVRVDDKFDPNGEEMKKFLAWQDKMAEVYIKNMKKMGKEGARALIEEVDASGVKRMVATEGFVEWLAAGAKDLTGSANPYPGADERGEQERAKAKENVAMAIANAIDAGRKAIEQSNKNFAEAMSKFNQDVVKSQVALSESLGKAMVKAQEQLDKQLVKMRENVDKQKAKLVERANEEEAKAQAQFDKRQLDEKEQFLRAMRRMEEDFDIALQEASADRDAKRVLQLMRAQAIQRKRANEDFSTRQRDEQTAFQERMKEFKNSVEEQKKALDDAYEEQKKDLQDALKERQDEMEANYREQMTELLNNAEKQRTAMNDAHTQQLIDLEQSNRDRLAEMTKQWADQKAIDEAGLNEVLGLMDKYYGMNGELEKLITDFVDRTKRNESITVTIKNGPTTDTAPTPTSPTTPTHPSPNPNTPTPMALGGIIRAATPTHVLMGDRGEETAFFVPGNANAMRDMFERMSNMTDTYRGGNSGWGESTSTLNIHLSSDGKFSEEFKDQVLTVIADELMSALPVKVTRGKTR